MTNQLANASGTLEVALVEVLTNTQEMLPSLVSDLLKWNLIKSGFVVCIFITFMFILYKIRVFILKQVPYDINDIKDIYEEQLIKLGTLIVVYIPLLGIFENIMNILCIYLTPKVWILEYTTNLIGQIK